MCHARHHPHGEAAEHLQVPRRKCSLAASATCSCSRRAEAADQHKGRTRIETVGIILFCALMTTVAVELIVSAAIKMNLRKVSIANPVVGRVGPRSDGR